MVITSLILMGIWFVVIGVARLCGKAFMLGSRKKSLFDKISDKDKRSYLLSTGLSLLLCGLTWIVMGLASPLSYAWRTGIIVIAGGVSTVEVLIVNKKILGRFL